MAFQEYKTHGFKVNYPDLEEKYDFGSKKLNKSKIDFVVSHGNCSDGFMSATIARMWMIQNGVDIDKVTFFNAYHGQSFDDLPEMMENRNVLICDFSFNKYLFDKMIKATDGNILVLDHHKTAKRNLQNTAEQYLVFDMDHSGAFITWTYFFGFTDIPKPVLYVEDNDIWTKALPCTLEFTAFMFSRPFEFEEYEKFFQDDYVMNVVFPTGSGMVIQNESYIKDLCKKAIPNFVKIAERYYFVPTINTAGILRSEIGNALMEHFKNANFSMIITHNQFRNSSSVSLRSINWRTDCSEISKLNGGGGHRNASGMGTFNTINHVPGNVIDKYRTYSLLNNVYSQHIYGHDFLMLNSPNLHTHVSAYLMQERFFNDEKETLNKDRYDANLPGYQEGMFVLRNNQDDSKLDQAFDGAIIWSYSGHSNRLDLTLNVLEKYTDLLNHNLQLLERINQKLPDNHMLKIMALNNSENKVTRGFRYSNYGNTFYRISWEFDKGKVSDIIHILFDENFEKSANLYLTNNFKNAESDSDVV